MGKLSKFSNLESLEVKYEDKYLSIRQNDDGNASVIAFFGFLLAAKHPKLQFVKLSHEKDSEWCRKRTSCRRHTRQFHCDREMSLRICKLIIALSLCEEMSIKTIELV